MKTVLKKQKANWPAIASRCDRFAIFAKLKLIPKLIPFQTKEEMQMLQMEDDDEPLADVAPKG